MATKTGVTTKLARGVISHTWEGFTASGDVGNALDALQYFHKTVHVYGTFATSGTINIQGENTATGSNWVTLLDVNGNAISATQALIREIQGNPRRVRPRQADTLGTVSIDIDVTLVAWGE